MMAAPPEMNANVRKFEEIGTHPAANHNAIAEALTFHEGFGAERKAARPRYLFQRWAKRLEKLPKVKTLTPSTPAQSDGRASAAGSGAVGVQAGACIWGENLPSHRSYASTAMTGRA